MYAIVDIETTGGYAANNDITEVAIVLHDGSQVVKRYETLVRPSVAIPYHIQVLTGINHAMVANAPSFPEVANDIYDLLQGNVFVAHNVNFDYSFLKHHLAQVGLELECSKLCTIRVARKVFPDIPSYSLGNLCRHFGILIENRHRAGGDADATARLFAHLLRHGGEAHIEQLLKKRGREQSLPPHLPKEEIDKLPYTPGIYYFHNQKGKIIYVGKAKNLKYRVCSHFTHNGAGRQRQDFLRNIYSISYQCTGTELMAFILESVEIRRLWPQFNYSQKRFTAAYGLYAFEDRNGYRRLAIEKKRRQLAPLYTFNWLGEGHRLMHQLITRFELCPRLCFIQTDNDPCVGYAGNPCRGACEQKEPPHEYNRRVDEAVQWLEQLLPTFALIGEGTQSGEQSCILMEKGKFYGMGYIPNDITITDREQLKEYLIKYPENDYIRGLIYQYSERFPQKKVLL